MSDRVITNDRIRTPSGEVAMSRLIVGTASFLMCLGVLPLPAPAQDRAHEKPVVGRIEVRPLGIRIERTVQIPSDSTRPTRLREDIRWASPGASATEAPGWTLW